MAEKATWAGDRADADKVSAWNHPEFLKLWIGQSVSLIGSRISEIAIPLTAVLTLQASPAQIGLLGAAEPAAWLLFGLFAGVSADRLRRRPIMIAADFGRAILLAVIPLAAVLGVLHIEMLYVISFVAGLLGVFFVVAYQSYLPTLVRQDALLARNGNLEASKSIAEIAGPGIAGTLVEVFTAPIAVLANAVSFLFSALTLASIRVTEETPSRPKKPSDIWPEVVEGVRFIFGHPVLRSLTLFMGAANLFVTAGMTLYPLYTVREIGISAEAFGFILAGGSGAALVGAMVSNSAVRRLGLGNAVLVAAFSAGVSFLLIPMAEGTGVLVIPMLAFSQAVFAFSITMANVNVITLYQVTTPERMLGRVNATQRMVIYGTPLVGALLGGFFGEVFGSRITLVMASGGQIAAAMWLAFSPVRELRELPGRREAN